MTERERVRRRLRRNYRRMLAECEQTVRDLDYWAGNRPEHPPIDSEWFKVQAAGLRKCLAALEADQPIRSEWLQYE